MTCSEPLTFSSRQFAAGVANIVKVWQGALLGAAHPVTCVNAMPDSSLSAEQLVAPPHAERLAPLVVDHATVAPFTGVVPSAATTRTRTGLAACPPTGVDGSDPCNSSNKSVEAAP